MSCRSQCGGCRRNVFGNATTHAGPSRPVDLHRRNRLPPGANEYAPANTFAAAQICVDWGMDYVEIDVSTSKDGVHYVFHGPELEYTTDGSGLFHERTSDEIDRLDAGSWLTRAIAASAVPRLDEFLRWIKGKAKVFLDVKHADLAQSLALVEQTQMQAECFFWFGDPQRRAHFSPPGPTACPQSQCQRRSPVHRCPRDLYA